MLCDPKCANGKCHATGECVDHLQAISDAPSIVPYQEQGRGYDSGASGYERQGRAASHNRRIIAFTGLAGAGKSTAAFHLIQTHGWARVRFAGPLKAMMAALGLSAAEIEGERKELPCALLGGRTPRYAMQTIGTEWGRDIINEDLWIHAWRAALDRVPAGVPVVVDDCRFPNEAAAVRAEGGSLIRIDRAGAGAGAAGHSSEGYAIETGAIIRNDGSVIALLEQIDDLALPAR